MLKKIGIALISVLLQFGYLFAADWWEKSHYTRWSKEQVESILNGSPWTSLIFIGRQRAHALAEVFHSDRIFFRMRLITARPVREALLRKDWMRRPVIGLEELKKADNVEKGASSELLLSKPNDVSAAGDGQYIVLTVSLRVITYQGWDEYTDIETLSNSDISNLTTNAFLTTNSGKRVALVKYEPPSSDGLGAKLYFPRTLGDGAPFISDRDREIIFETQINNKPATATFDLRRMKYQGKLEI
jgi:hypothetical protein